jgi:hypothetical protein
MSRRVLKFKLLSDVNEFDLPQEPKVVLAGPDYSGAGCIWVEIDENDTLVKQKFYVFGTGHEIHDSTLEHVISYKDGGLIWHIYQEGL